MDSLALNRTGPTDTLPRLFGLLPTSFGQRLDFLNERDLRKDFYQHSLVKQR
jgi:hypothetical protein